MVDQARVDELNTTRGFLTRIGFASEPLRGQRPVYSFDSRDPEAMFEYQKVLAGYACSECLADFGATYRVKCPVCGASRDALADAAVETPPEWLAYLRYRDEQVANPTRTPLIDMEQTIRRVMGDPDVEHTTLSKLKSRRG